MSNDVHRFYLRREGCKSSCGIARQPNSFSPFKGQSLFLVINNTGQHDFSCMEFFNGFGVI